MSEKEEQRNEGLTTADLAGVGKRTASSDVPVAVATAPATDEQAAPLLSSDEAKDLRARWDTIQAGFVDEPRRAVEQADNLVAEAMKRLAEMFADERAKLEGQIGRAHV